MKGTTFRAVFNPATGKSTYYMENPDYFRKGSQERNAWKRISAERYENAETYSRCTGRQSFGPCYPHNGKFYTEFTIMTTEA